VNPAYSIIFFTTAAGAGYGLLTMLALYALAGDPAANGREALLPLGLAGVLVSAGLLASTLHLGHPERAWRALSQWRSSWLSREGVLAIACYGPALVWAWRLWREAPIGPVVPAFTAVLGLATVYATSQIYASLKSVDAWHLRLVPANYLLLALASGSVLWQALRVWAGVATAVDALPVATLMLAAGVGKWRYWRTLSRLAPTSTLATATGLGTLGTVSSLAWPHTEQNYLLKEMGFVVARRHADKLRRIALLCACILPPLLALGGSVSGGWPASLIMGLAVALLALGLVLERWLFFAEARHSVSVFYGR